MDQLANQLLSKLFVAGEKQVVGERARVAALTTSQLRDYRSLNSLTAKESFETTIDDARVSGAIEVHWDAMKTGGNSITRINLIEPQLLAAFLGKTPKHIYIDQAQQQLTIFLDRFPVLSEVIARWKKLKSVRGSGSKDYQEWVDAVRVVEFVKRKVGPQDVILPIREASSQLFNDSKRIEQLVGPIDVLLSGDIDAGPRASVDVWQEIGLFREEYPARLAGNVSVRRERVTSLIDTPYSGFPADTVLGLASQPTMLMTIENQTTFHSEARRRQNENVLLIFTAGTPSPGWRRMYLRILNDLATNVPIYHWGDIDEGGFRIASILSGDAKGAGRVIRPWRMHPDDVPLERQIEGTGHTVSRMKYFA